MVRQCARADSSALSNAAAQRQALPRFDLDIETHRRYRPASLRRLVKLVPHGRFARTNRTIQLPCQAKNLFASAGKVSKSHSCR